MKRNKSGVQLKFLPVFFFTNVIQLINLINYSIPGNVQLTLDAFHWKPPKHHYIANLKVDVRAEILPRDFL